MRRLHFILILIMTLSLLQAPDQSLAHGGGHEKAKPAAEEPAAARETESGASASDTQAFEDSIYAEDSEETAPNDFGEYDLGETDPSPLNPDIGLLTDGIPAEGAHADMEMSGGAGGEEHSMEEIELASHEWVSSSRKGYSAALGVTLLAGLVFGFLTIKRPFE